MAKAINIGSFAFKSIKDAKEYFRAIFRSYKTGEVIDRSHKDFPLWFAYLQERHPNVDRMNRFGIDHFVCLRNENYPSTRSLYIVNSVGDKDMFAYERYLSSKATLRLNRIIRSMRREVEYQIADFRKGYKGGHVHHKGKSFDQIADEWLKSIPPEKFLEFNTMMQGSRGEEFEDRELAASWREYHKRNATLEIIDAKTNMSAGNSGYQKTFVQPLPPPPY